ncbi:hypothetical protein FCN77_02330 [Arthrobacter sp. 24S4-2]|uniref:hypothetical protein n=1 Tax=Arthrobacter sp. 24S4-2 TaxID=2575374 RepID=UPI0010C7CBCB|nr:hypothetical protein [Arthrobacter sp. 24S4-2]QCO96767.1 hypothetical protein FCN77_02330 [Arthrobacter sp. 24S4-2]
MWYLLGPDDKQFLHSNFRSIVAGLAAPIPQSRALELVDMAEAGQLGVHRGLQSVRPTGTSQFELCLEDYPPQTVDKVISATAVGSRIPPTAVQIIEALTSSGQARLHPFGGLEVDRTTSRILDDSMTPQSRLYALGGTVSGALYIFNSLMLTRRRSAHVADAIIGGGESSPDSQQDRTVQMA